VLVRKSEGGTVLSKTQGEEPPYTGGGRGFSLDAALGLLATRQRLGRRGDSSAMRSAFVV